MTFGAHAYKSNLCNSVLSARVPAEYTTREQASDIIYTLLSDRVMRAKLDPRRRDLPSVGWSSVGEVSQESSFGQAIPSWTRARWQSVWARRHISADTATLWHGGRYAAQATSVITRLQLVSWIEFVRASMSLPAADCDDASRPSEISVVLYGSPSHWGSVIGSHGPLSASVTTASSADRNSVRRSIVTVNMCSVRGEYDACPSAGLAHVGRCVIVSLRLTWTVKWLATSEWPVSHGQPPQIAPAPGRRWIN